MLYYYILNVIQHCREKVEWGCQSKRWGLGVERKRHWLTSLHLWFDKGSVMETGGGGRCAAKRLDLMSLNCTFKMVKKVKSILGVFHHTHTCSQIGNKVCVFFLQKTDPGRACGNQSLSVGWHTSSTWSGLAPLWDSTESHW